MNNLKKVLTKIILLICCLFAVCIMWLLPLYYFTSGYDGISKKDQSKAIEFCKELHKYSIEHNAYEFMSYEMLPQHLKDIAPSVIDSIKFGFKNEGSYSKCCFKSTMAGSPDFGYADCLKQDTNGAELLPPVKTIFGLPCNSAWDNGVNKTVREITYKGEKTCANIGL